MTNQKKRISIKDVARESGVSIGTVSRILNQTGRYSKETEKKVLDVAERLNYERNRLAISLVSNESRTIGILVPDITNEFFANIVKNCEQMLFEAGYASIICNTERSISRENAYTRVLIEQQVEGIIIISSNNNQNTILKDNPTPTVFIDRNLKDENETTVASDHYGGAVLATNYLLKTHYIPYMVVTRTKSSATVARISAFEDVLQQNKFNNFEEHVFELDLTSNQFMNATPELNAFIKRVFHPGKPIGIFGVNDNVAYMVIRAAKNLNLRIPEDISVIGFDGTYFADISSPTLTTIVQNTPVIAKTACKLLLNDILQARGGKTVQPQNISIPVKILIQESTK